MSDRQQSQTRRDRADPGVRAALQSPAWMTLGFALAGAVIVLFVAAPLVAMVAGTSPAEVVEAFDDPQVRSALWTSVTAALTATAFGFVFGVPLAYLLARRQFRGKRLLEGLIDLPIVFPHTAAGIALLLVFGREGAFGSALAKIGLEFTDTFAGIVVAMAFVSVPFLIDTARESFALVDERQELVARTLGASPGMAFLRVTLPQARRGVLAGAVLMWARGISEFGAVVILAYNPKVLPVLVFERFEGYGLAAAEPLAALIALVALVVFVLLRLVIVPSRAARGGRRRSGDGRDGRSRP